MKKLLTMLLVVCFAMLAFSALPAYAAAKDEKVVETLTKAYSENFNGGDIPSGWVLAAPSIGEDTFDPIAYSASEGVSGSGCLKHSGRSYATIKFKELGGKLTTPGIYKISFKIKADANATIAMIIRDLKDLDVSWAKDTNNNFLLKRGFTLTKGEWTEISCNLEFTQKDISATGYSISLDELKNLTTTDGRVGLLVDDFTVSKVTMNEAGSGESYAFMVTADKDGVTNIKMDNIMASFKSGNDYIFKVKNMGSNTVAFSARITDWNVDTQSQQDGVSTVIDPGKVAEIKFTNPDLTKIAGTPFIVLDIQKDGDGNNTFTADSALLIGPVANAGAGVGFMPITTTGATLISELYITNFEGIADGDPIPTKKPSATKKPTDPTEPGGDTGVLLFGLAAVTALGALVITRKKRFQ